jgi:hypothetical protein
MAKRQQLELLPPAIIDPNRKRLGEWQEDHKGRRRLGGRWNLFRMAELLQGNPHWQTVDDLARVVYGSNSPKNRDNVRKHIPAQRRYMLNSLELPIVTRYGERGRIMAIKMYSSGLENDKVLLKMDLDRLRDRKEITDSRYNNLLRIFMLEGPIE